MAKFSNSLYLHIYNITPGMTVGKLIKIAQNFSNPVELFSASKKKLEQAGLDLETAEKFISLRDEIDLNEEIKKLEQEQITLLSINDSNYPQMLREIPNAPALLYVKGNMQTPDEICLAVVGTRKISNYGRTVTPLLLEPLIATGVTIVSGLAFGIDSLAHNLCCHTGKRTIAILGGGLDNRTLYPKEHQLLADEILKAGGALLSEYPPGTPPLKHHFLARNRILSGISLGTLVVECNLKSGSLITAQYALEQNRQLFAVPGPIYSEGSRGPNNLIKMGAKLVTNAADILQDLNLETLPEQRQSQNLLGDNPLETQILKTLSFEPININELIKILEMDTGSVTASLTFLEMKGKVKNLGGQQYILSR